MKINQIIATAALLVSSTFANPWTDCGIGGAIGSLIEKQPAANIVASVSNIVWDLGTSATTSAVSTPDLCANKETAAAKFINDTHSSLEVETARGQGENLAALMSILEISAEHQTSFSANLRNEYSSIVTSPAYLTLSKTEKAQAYYNTMLSVYTNI